MTTIEERVARQYACGPCGETKQGSEFRWKGFKRDSYCKPCRRAKYRERYENSNGAGKDKVFDHSLRRLYGITLAQYQEMAAAQQNLCGICGEPPETANRLHVDHDHETGRIRSLLCHHCNLLLGNARDSISRLRKAIGYLEHHGHSSAAGGPAGPAHS